MDKSISVPAASSGSVVALAPVPEVSRGWLLGDEPDAVVPPCDQDPDRPARREEPCRPCPPVEVIRLDPRTLCALGPGDPVLCGCPCHGGAGGS
jgi:hypothetical protein